MKQTYIIIVAILSLLNSQLSFLQCQVLFTDTAPALGLNDPGAGQGAVFLDVNNDGYLDIFLVNNNNPNKLWINNSGASFSDQSAVFGLSLNAAGRGCSSGDYDNDGLIDIMVGNFNQTLVLYKNNTTTYTIVTSVAGISFTSWGGSINWFDCNSDGRLDAVLGNDGVPYHYNYLFRNDNLTSFTNVAYASGLTDSASTLTIAGSDYDNDGDIDLFCGSQTNLGASGTGLLYRNNGGSFSDVTIASGIVTGNYTWGADWGDYDNDGDMDLYLANFTGLNQLYKNNGNGTFTETAVSLGLNDAGQSFSCGWFDYDNDGDIDLYIAKSSTAVDRLYQNNEGSFTDVAATVGTNDTRHSANITLGDYNNDGFLDIYLVNNGSENRLYKSNAGNSNKWVILKLRGVVSNRSAVGARVTVKTGSWRQIREVQGGSGGKGQNSLPVEFGIGGSSVIDSLIVRWPSGNVQAFTSVAPNVIYSLVEGQGLSSINVTGTEIPHSFALEQNYPNPFNPVTNVKFQIPIAAFVKLIIYDITGREITTLVNEQLNAGTYQADWDASGYPSGVYLYKLLADGFTDVKKMMLLK
ncbi:MAG: FG-GAP-like repeat-containing protein [Chlorobi bacterium]|nr:FG-GAP-like repeat-containing protein [Chlorobiota bacterium]MCI0717010.1 FG-GAP-like repeat-containing protein [Chlorobiota bacterium]